MKSKIQMYFPEVVLSLTSIRLNIFDAHPLNSNLLGRCGFWSMWNSQIHFGNDRILSASALPRLIDKQIPACCQNPVAGYQRAASIASVQQTVTQVDHGLPWDRRGQGTANHPIARSETWKLENKQSSMQLSLKQCEKHDISINYKNVNYIDVRDDKYRFLYMRTCRAIFSNVHESEKVCSWALSLVGMHSAIYTNLSLMHTHTRYAGRAGQSKMWVFPDQLGPAHMLRTFSCFLFQTPEAAISPTPCWGGIS